MAVLASFFWSSQASVITFNSEYTYLPPDSTSTSSGDSSNTEENLELTDDELPFPFDDGSEFQYTGDDESSPLYMKQPSNISSTVEYNPKTGEY